MCGQCAFCIDIYEIYVSEVTRPWVSPTLEQKHCRNRRKSALGSLVVKQGVGVRDAWAQEGLTQKEIDSAFREAGLSDQFAIATDFLPTAIGHFLTLGHQTGAMPPFGLVRFLEAVGVSSVQPQLMSAASLLDTVEEGRVIGPDAFEHLLADGFDLAADYVFIGSWFEVGDEVDTVLMRNRQFGSPRCQSSARSHPRTLDQVASTQRYSQIHPAGAFLRQHRQHQAQDSELTQSRTA
jgi:hypothetical protein